MMKLVFYAVNNSKNYYRHSFDCDDSVEVTLDKLRKLKYEEWRMYDMEHYGYGQRPYPNAADFEHDYNNEDLDGGWWVIVLHDKK